MEDKQVITDYITNLYNDEQSVLYLQQAQNINKPYTRKRLR